MWIEVIQLILYAWTFKELLTKSITKGSWENLAVMEQEDKSFYKLLAAKSTGSKIQWAIFLVKRSEFL